MQHDIVSLQQSKETKNKAIEEAFITRVMKARLHPDDDRLGN